MKKLALLMLLFPVAAGCASAQAKSPVDRPNLDVPAPPPRVIEPRVVYEPPPPEPVPDLPAASPTSPRPRQTPPAREKPDPKPEAPAAEVAPPVTQLPVAPAVPQLRTPGTVDGAEAARQIKEVIESARRTLGSIDYRPLNSQRRAQYDSAKLMITQSEDALKSQNYDLAKGLADKAERIAKELPGR